MDKSEKLAQLRDAWAGCERCGLCAGRTNMVFGEGNANARILIVGEAPGAEEDESGKPFVGEAGKVLNVFTESALIDRRNDTYITNTVCCRPFSMNTDPQTKRTFKENRVPSRDERAACRQRLMETIYIVDPVIIVALGKTALQSLLGQVTSIAKMRGNIYTMHLPGRTTEVRYPVLAMFHPAFLARSTDYKSKDGPWQQTARDFHALTSIVDDVNHRYYGIKRNRDEEIARQQQQEREEDEED